MTISEILSSLQAGTILEQLEAGTTSNDEGNLTTFIPEISDAENFYFRFTDTILKSNQLGDIELGFLSDHSANVSNKQYYDANASQIQNEILNCVKS